MNLVKDAFAGVAERDIYTGDRVEIVVIDKNGTTTEYFDVCVFLKILFCFLDYGVFNFIISTCFLYIGRF